ncbi:MAG: metallophosphoesterase [Anaerovoracaceae bacterium]|nr:metallophosphoesterase [Bacillota bacterium]MEE0516456.1 metallophosphoesterase [Anaerovoracaceae bacterium]
MKIFAIGDLHLSFDKSVQKPMDIFGPMWHDHTDRLQKNWIETVNEEDTVIVCGDISWGLRLKEAASDFEWIRSLPGRKLIFKGNHDLWWQSAGKLNKLYGDDKLIFVQNDAVVVECGERGEKSVAVCGSRGWTCPGSEGFSAEDEKIYRRELIRLEMSLKEGASREVDSIIGVLHFPPTNDNKQSSGFTELMSNYNVKTCVYGHIHGTDAFKNGLQGILNGVRYELVSLDYLNARPKEVII